MSAVIEDKASRSEQQIDFPRSDDRAASGTPDDWDITPLGKICATSSGTTPSRKLRDRYYTSGNIAWVKTLDLSNSEIYETDESVTALALQETSLTQYPVGTILVAMYGGFNQIGRTGLLRIPAAVNQAITAIQPNRSRLIPEYLLAVLNLHVDHWKSVASSSRKDPNITSEDVRRFPIPHPRSLSEQRAIAAVLSDMDTLIDALNKLIAKKRALKLTAMQQLLTGSVRLSSFGATRDYKETAVGRIPRRWDAVLIGDLLQFKNGLNKAKRYFGIGTPIVNYMDVYERSWLRSEQIEGRVSLTQSEVRAFNVQKGDVLFTRTSETADEVGIASVVIDVPPHTVFSGFLLRGRPKNNRIDDEFKRYCFGASAVRRQIISKATYTTRALTNGRSLSAVVVALPPPDEQRAIASVLSDLDSELVSLERHRDKTMAIKRGMMQQLLTARVRLVRLETTA